MRATTMTSRARATIALASVVLIAAACVPDTGPQDPTTTSSTTPTSTTTIPADNGAYAYVANTNLGVIEKIDTVSLTTLATIPVGAPLGDDIALVGNRIFYTQTNSGTGAVGVYDLTSGVNNRNYLPAAAAQERLWASRSLPGRLFVASSGSPAVIRSWNVSGPTPTAVATMPAGAAGSNVQDVEVSADGTLMWVAATSPNEVTELRTSDLVATGRKFSTGAQPQAVASRVVGGAELVLTGRGTTATTGSQAFVFNAADPATVTPYALNRTGAGDRGVDKAGIGISRDGAKVYAVVEGATGSNLATVNRANGSITREPLFPDDGASSLTPEMGELGVDPATGRVFVSGRDHLAVLNPDGSPGLVMSMSGPRGIEFSATAPNATDPPPITTTTTTTTTTTSTTTTTTSPGGPPTITSFVASKSSGPAPLTTAFTWAVSDPDPGPLTCGLDTDGDGTFELTISNCTSAAARSVTYPTAGTRTARLRVSDGTTTVTSSPLTITVGAASADAFNITLRFDPSVTTAQRAVFEAAATRWSQVIRTGLPDASVNAAANFCGTGAPAYNGAVDDLLIDASIVPIDGVSGVLGVAGPCLVRSTGGLPAFGAMQFDSADVAAMAADGRLSSVILHEMGHVLGFGTVWDTLATNLGTADPRFVGLTARGAWSALTGGAADPVPVEGTGGPGTAGSHWRETVFGTELMTGWISSGSNPLSRVTVASLADLGYGVDLGAADAFPWAASRDPDTPTTQIRTDLILPKGTVG